MVEGLGLFSCVLAVAGWLLVSYVLLREIRGGAGHRSCPGAQAHLRKFVALQPAPLPDGPRMRRSPSPWRFVSATRPRPFTVNSPYTHGWTARREKSSGGLHRTAHAPVDTGALSSNTTVSEIQAARRTGRRGLFPPIQPYNVGRFEVTTAAGTTHSIYYEECGNQNGQPVVFLHGGPGGGVSDDYRQFHDPTHYRIVLFDQRGCGRSTPHASLDENTTWHLVEDIERLREICNVESWQVFGGSWGSTLALSYAVKHPGRVSGLLLRGIFLLRDQELKWYYQSGASYIYPDMFEGFRNAVPLEERHDLISAYRKRLVGEDEEAKVQAAKAWTRWENTTSTLFVDASDEVKGDDAKFALAFARIENHFFHNRGFFDWDGWLLDQVDRIRHIPTVIVQGRYDVVCPAQSAWDLHTAMPEADFHIVQDSGHGCMEPGTLDVLVRATEKLKLPRT